MLIPNLADAESAAQAQVDARDFQDILAVAPSLTGVLSGCAVTAQGSPDMTVAVAVGTVVVAGLGATVAAGNVTITAADATNARFDLICVDSAGAKSAVAGAPAADPVFPNPSGKVVLAAVYVPANDTTIETQKIVDKRMMLAPFSGSGKTISTYRSFLDAPVGTAFVATLTYNNAVDTFTPLPLFSPISISGLGIYVATAGGAGTLARLALYRADANWLPTALVVDAGTVAIDSTGEKTATFSDIRLAPGRYMSVVNSNDLWNPRSVRGLALRGTNMAAAQFPDQITVARAFGAFADPYSGTPAVAAAASGAMPYTVFVIPSEAF